MRTLYIHLPLADASPGTVYAHTVVTDAGSAAGTTRAAAAQLPAADARVAVVPAQALSWLRVVLPKGALAAGGQPTPRLRAVLDGLLEDRLLDEPDALHLALAADARVGQETWVAVCNKVWLKGHLQTLESSQHPAHRVLPEIAPHSDQAGLLALGEPDHTLLAWFSAHGAGVLPLTDPMLQLASRMGKIPADMPVQASPSAAAQAEARLTRPVRLVPDTERWAAAAQGSWDLAQFDLASSGGRRLAKRLQQHVHALRSSPAWRAWRWGMALTLAAQLAGLNLWAYRETQALAAKRSQVQATLQQTFPQVRVVVDAPVQMARELALLRQATGGFSAQDLEAALTAAGAALPPGPGLRAIDFNAGETRLKGLPLGSEEGQQLLTRLQAAGYNARPDGDTLVLQAVTRGPTP